MVNDLLQPILQRAPRNPSASELLTILGGSDVVHNLFPGRISNFYAVVVGQPVGIHHTKESAQSSSKGFAFPYWKEMPTFWDALAFMIIKGIEELLTDTPKVKGVAGSSQNILPVPKWMGEDTPSPVLPITSTPAVKNLSSSPDDCSPSTSQHCPIIYTHVCNLHGVIESRFYVTEWDPPTESAADTLGVHAVKYLQAHGYIESAVAAIVVAYLTSCSEQEFALSMAKSGLPLAEGFFLWYLFHL